MRAVGGRGRNRPPWWPEGETWPPTADWRGARRVFLRRIGCLFAVLPLLIFAVGLLNAVFGARRNDDRYDGPPFGFVGLVVLVLVVAGVGRAVRRTAAPIGDVMEAADRVAAGDYAVRDEARAGGEVGRLVAAFNEMAARLQANEAQRRTLFADVAHELRTPLVVIRGNVEGMLDGVYPRDDEHLAPVLEETTVMARLLDDLRLLSMAEAGALRLHREPTDLAALIADVVAAFAPRAASAGVALTAAVSGLPPEDAEVDPLRVREVLENLVANALRHTPRGGTIQIEATLRSAAGGPEVAVAVVDTGTGIAAALAPHVFDRFAKSADSGGSGLGLAIAKSLVEAHGGLIGAESAPGRGTTIRFTLPVGSARRRP